MMDGKENLDQMSEPRKEIYSGMVSIIVPIYNGEKNIEKCILSILNQTYKKFELITTHVVVSSKTRKGTRYIALWKNGNRKTFMLHKLYAEAFYMSENEACRRLYKGFIGYGQAVQNVKDILLKNLSDLEKEQAIGENRHDEILYIQQFLDELKNDKVCGVRQVENIK